MLMNTSLKKETMRAVLNSAFVFLYSVLYTVMTYVIYDKNSEFNYGVRGYIVLTIIYIIVLILFLNIFGAFQIGNKRISDICLSSIMALVISNITMYFVFSLIEGHLVITTPYIILLIIQSAISIPFSVFGNETIRYRYKPLKTLVIHGNSNYKGIIEKLSRYQHYEFSINRSLFDSKINYNKLNQLINDYECVITIEVGHESKKRIVKCCYENDKCVYDVPSITDIIIKSSDVTNFIDSPLLKMNKLGPNQIENIIKRIIDILGASILLIIGLIPMLISAIIIKFQDGGSIFFKQKRLTKDGKVFELVKFRSMVMNAEPEGKAIRAKTNDNRITKYGKFIRATRIDELPQIFNILKGDISFVGPRALRVEEYEQNEKDFPEFKYRLKVKAGLTGYAQVYGKYNTTFRDKLLLDIYYIENYDLIMDIKLILMTIITVFKKESTEGF